MSFHIIQKNVNLATSLYSGAESEYIIIAQTFSSLQMAKCGWELTITIHLTYFIWSYYAFQSNLESAGAVQTLKSVWGCYFDAQIVPGFLFLRFCGNLKSQGNAPINSNLQLPPPPGHLTVRRARGGGNLNVALKGWGI